MEARKGLQPQGWSLWSGLFGLSCLSGQRHSTEETRETYSSFVCLLPDRRLITTNMMMVTPKSQRLGRP